MQSGKNYREIELIVERESRRSFLFFNIANIKFLILRVAFSVLLFSYLFAPRLSFIPINTDKLSVIFLIVIIFGLGSARQSVSLLMCRDVVKLVGLLYGLFVLTFLYLLLDSSDWSRAYKASQFAFQYIPSTILLYAVGARLYDADFYKEVPRIVFYGVLVSSIVGMLMFLDPDVKNRVYQLQYGGTPPFHENLFLRGNGVGSGLLFSFPVICSLVAIWFIIFDTKCSVLFRGIGGIVVIIVAISNARTALVPVILFLPILIRRYFSTFGNIPKFSHYAVPMVGLICYYFIYKSAASDVDLRNIYILWDWFVGGYASVFGVELQNNNESVRDILLRENLHFHSDALRLLFGNGENIFLNENTQSDIGYINILWFGGIIFLFIIIFIFFIFYKISQKRLQLLGYSPSYKALVVGTVATFIVCAAKGNVLFDQLFDRWLVFILLLPILEFNRIKFEAR